MTIPENMPIDKIVITDLAGKTVVTEITNTKQAKVQDLAIGMYIIQVFSGVSQFQSIFIKN